MTASNTNDNWTSAWLDALAFAVGLAVAWWGGWNAGDLVWSLWLSSFVVGYTLIIWMIGQPTVAILRASWRERAIVGGNPRSLIILSLLVLGGALFLLAFFTVHFGGFHYGHSQFLISFFPADLPGSGRASWAGYSTYAEVMRRYWPFLPSAFLAHRAAFLRPPLSLSPKLPSELSDSRKMGSIISEPYRNVIRMHMLIFFFFFAHFARLENYAVYAVVYAVYFFPWRLVRKPASQPTPIPIRQQ